MKQRTDLMVEEVSKHVASGLPWRSMPGNTES